MPITQASILEIAQQAQDTGTGCTRVILVDTAGTNEAAVSAGNALKVDGSAATQPVSGTVTAAQATAANLKATVLLQDGSANAITSSYSTLDVNKAGSFINLAANATTTVKSGAGILQAVVLNTKGIGNTVTIYDSLAGSGTKIATIDTTLTIGTLEYDLKFATGLTLVIAGGTAVDLTVTYK